MNDEIDDSPAALRADADVLAQAASVLRTRFTRQSELAAAVREAQVTLISRSRHPSRQRLRGGVSYTPGPAPEGTEATVKPEQTPGLSAAFIAQAEDERSAP